MKQYPENRIVSAEKAFKAESIISSTLKASILMVVFIPFYFLFDQQFVNTWFPLVLGGICLGVIFSFRRADLSQVVLMPITWFLLACTVYYGVGPLLYVYGNYVSLEMTHEFYYVSDLALWRTNLLNVISIASILFFFSIGMSSSLLKPFKSTGNEDTLKRAAHFFAGIGVIFSLLTYGLRMALGQDFLMPGVFYNLAQCSLASLFLYSLLYARGLREIKVPLLLMTGFVGYMAFASLMKQNILQFVMMLFLGAFVVRPSIRKLTIAACVVLITFPVLSMVTTYGRILLWTDESANTATVSLDRVIKAASDSDAIADIKEAEEGNQGTLRRISCTAAQSFAMDSYDAGTPGHSFNTALWAFVPRLIYPDKPVITLGSIFTELVRGEAIGGGTGAGFFGEAYWNLGWFGVMAMSVYVGMLLAAYTQFNSNMVSTGNYQFIPVALLMMMVGYRVDDWLVATTFNSIPLMIFLYIMVKLVSGRPS